MCSLELCVLCLRPLRRESGRVRQQVNRWPLSIEMSTAVRWRGLGRVNFGPLLVNLEFGERKGQLNFTSCSQVHPLDLYTQYLYTWIPGCSMDVTAMTLDQGGAVKPVTREALHVEDYVFLEAYSHYLNPRPVDSIKARDHIQQRHRTTSRRWKCPAVLANHGCKCRSNENGQLFRWRARV